MSDFLKEQMERRATEDARNKRLTEIAQQQGYVLISMSPRRHIVIKTSGNSGVTLMGDKHRTVLRGDLVHGPDTLSNCYDYLATVLPAVPPELVG